MVECKTNSKISRNSLSFSLLPHSAAYVRGSCLANIPECSLVLSLVFLLLLFSCLAWGLHQAGGFNLSGGRSGFSSACPSCRLSTDGAPPTGRTISLPSTSADLSFFPFIISLDCPTKSQTTMGIERTLLKDQGERELSKVRHSRMGVGMRRWRKKGADWECWHIYTMISLLLVTYTLWFNLHQSLRGRWNEPRVTKKEIRLREVT